MITTPAQIRAPRAFLDWGRDELKAASQVSAETIVNLEDGRFEPSPETAEKIRLTFTNHGVGFFDFLAGQQRVWGVLLAEPSHASEQDNQALDAGDETERRRRADLANRMADVIARVIRERGYCRARDLETKGFSRSEIAESWATANGLAHVQLGTPEDEI